MSQRTYQVDVSLALNLDQIKKIVLSLPRDQQKEIIFEIINSFVNFQTKSTKNLDQILETFIKENPEKSHDNSNMISVFERISQNAEARGLTEEILEELLADES